MSEPRGIHVTATTRQRGRNARHAVPWDRWPRLWRLEPRLRPPATGGRLVPRTDLVARLREAAGVRVVLLCAGAGAGKTSLLAQWAENDGRPFGWVSLDASDDDPAALVADVTRALDLVETAGEDRPLGPPGAQGHAHPWLPLAARPRPFVLVLDDVHEVRSPQCLALLAAVVDHLPPGSQLAMAGREEPALPLARWSVRGDLLRLGWKELAMTPAEAAKLLGAAGAEVAPPDLEVLLRRTEGWAAGLCLAARWLQREPAGEGAAARFAGHARPVADYLRDEVLSPLPVERAQFLTRTSVLDRLSGPLCDAVLGTTGSGMVLRDLERSTLFVVPLDGARRWYRCHRLFADMLLAELRVQDPALEPELHRRASDWHEAHGDPARAIRHARAAGDVLRAAELVWAGLPPRLCAGDLAGPERWLRGFRDADVAGHPALAVAAAWCSLERGDGAAARRWAAAAERGPGGGPRAAAAGALAAAVRAMAGEDGQARMAEDAAVGRDAHAADAWRALCRLLEGVAWRLRGDSERARASLSAGEQLAGSAPVPLVRCLAHLALLAVDRGDWEQAAALAARARAAADSEALREHPCTIETFAVSALLLARQGQPAESAGDARRSQRLLARAGHVPAWLAAEARIVLARARLLVGDAPASRALLREARRALLGTAYAGVLGPRLEQMWQEAEAFRLAGVVAPTPLSRAELRVLGFLPTHLSYREIAGRLHVSPCTVKSQALSVYRKLDVSSRSQAVERAVALALVPGIDAGASSGPLPWWEGSGRGLLDQSASGLSVPPGPPAAGAPAAASPLAPSGSAPPGRARRPRRG